MHVRTYCAPTRTGKRKNNKRKQDLNEIRHQRFSYLCYTQFVLTAVCVLKCVLCAPPPRCSWLPTQCCSLVSTCQDCLCASWQNEPRGRPSCRLATASKRDFAWRTRTRNRYRHRDAAEAAADIRCMSVVFPLFPACSPFLSLLCCESLWHMHFC